MSVLASQDQSPRRAADKASFKRSEASSSARACLSLFGDVASDLGGADDLPVRAPDRRDSQRNVDQPAIFSHAHGFVVLDTFARPESGEDCRLFIFMIFGDEDRDWFADYFVGGVTKDALRTVVPTRDDALECLADDRVVGGFD